MTLREKLADWLTGGKYSDNRIRAISISSTYIELYSDYLKKEQHLRTIASIPVSPTSNGQTRKAVRIAKEALAA